MSPLASRRAGAQLSTQFHRVLSQVHPDAVERYPYRSDIKGIPHMRLMAPALRKYLDVDHIIPKGQMMPFRELVESLQAASNRDTCLASQRSRPAGVRTPRASSSWAMARGVGLVRFRPLPGRAPGCSIFGQHPPVYGSVQEDLAVGLGNTCAGQAKTFFGALHVFFCFGHRHEKGSLPCLYRLYVDPVTWR